MPVADFSLDVLHLVFDYVAFDELLCCTHVSLLWRTAGRRHPTYWKWLVVEDRLITPGLISLFLERLNSKTGAEATIYVDITLPSLPDELADALLGALCDHIHRAVRFGLTCSSSVASRLQALFGCSAPRLQDLSLIIAWHVDSSLKPFPTMFNLHTHNHLRDVTLIDVPLESGLLPVTHVLNSLTVFYFDHVPELQHVLSWLPKFEMLMIASPTLEITTPISPPPLRHLSLLCENWQPIIRSLSPLGELASLGVSARQPTPRDVADILPTSPELCICLKTQLSASMHGPPAEWGALAIATPDRAVIRLLHHVDIAYMASESFVKQFIPSERIVKLVVSLTCGFIEICRSGCTFPHLETLCLGISHYPTELSSWEWGALACPRLRTLAFQSETDDRPTLLVEDVERFIGQAFVRTTSSRLDIVLKDVLMAGTPPSGCAGAVRHQSPRVRWMYDTGMDWSDGVAIRTDWMDI